MTSVRAFSRGSCLSSSGSAPLCLTPKALILLQRLKFLGVGQARHDLDGHGLVHPAIGALLAKAIIGERGALNGDIVPGADSAY